MAVFWVAAAAHNLTSPNEPLSVSGVTIVRPSRPRLAPEELSPLLAHLPAAIHSQLMLATHMLEFTAAKCLFHTTIERAEPDAAHDAGHTEFQKLGMAIELITLRAVELGASTVAPVPLAPDGFLAATARGGYRRGMATVERQHLAVLEEIISVLNTKPSKRIETAMLEWSCPDSVEG